MNNQSLEGVIETLQKRPLSKEEVGSINEFKKHFKVDDDDPLIVVLALMARSQLILESLPTSLEKKATETIELHRIAMREQSVLIAKDLIGILAEDINKQISESFKIKHTLSVYKQIFVFGGVFLSGSAFAFLLKVIFTKFLHAN
jgi:hypothetical protein